MATCVKCGRIGLPTVSDVPPSPELASQVREWLRFAQEFELIDPDEDYGPVDFVHWMALNVGAHLHRDSRPKGLKRLPSI